MQDLPSCRRLNPDSTSPFPPSWRLPYNRYMLTRRFEWLFGRLLSAFVAYDDAPRTADRVPELGTLRIELDQVRSEIADERNEMAEEGIVARRRVRQAGAFIKTALSADDIAVLQVHGIIGT